tara:strand:- start:2 stop:445 length:444 start_codon:yes stop_codon:yes gene_type:complete
MSYTGRYVPTNPKKYKGNPTTIYYRSLWERKFMVYCDKNPRILEWGSEEIIIPYLLPTDGKVHRYFPDFYIKVKRSDNKIRKMIIEVKPEKYTKPPKKPKKETKSFIKDVYEWGRNQAKWKHAREYCRDRNMDFLILTEKHLMPQYK